MEEKQMKTLGGYEIVDEKAREDINIVAEKANEALTVAKGATRAFVYDTYSDMISGLNKLPKTELQVNYHVMIREVCVPDLWVSGISDEHVEYTYTSNEDFIADLTQDGVVQVGYFVLSALETQKVELDDYVKKDDYATADKVGLVKCASGYGIGVDKSGNVSVSRADEDTIDARTSSYKPIVPRHLDYAVMKALSDSKLEWTEEQKQAVRELLGAIGANNVDASNGLAVLANGSLIISPASKAQIEKRADNAYDTTSQRKPVTLTLLDYAVKKALSDCKLSGEDVWTEEEKAKALELLGGVASSLVSHDAKNGTIVLRGATGAIFVGAPKSNSHATTKKYVDDGFVAKSTDKSTYHQVYAKSANGEEQWLTDFSKGADAQTLAQRDVGGTLQVGAPTMERHATTKKYVDEGFVPQVKESASLQRVYAIAQDGTQKALNASENPFSNALVLFGAGGIVKVGTPTADNHATNKGYVDDLVGSVESILTELHAHAESLIGGES